MKRSGIYAMQTDRPDIGQLQIRARGEQSDRPIEGATVDISYTGEPDRVIEEVRTDTSGQTDTLNVSAPPLEYSMEPSENQPYAEYTVRVSAPGYEDVTVTGIEVFSGEKAIQEIEMRPSIGQPPTDVIVIGPHTLFATFPPKIAEAEIKPLTETGEIVLKQVVVPEYIVVHDGSPRDSTAENYYVKYKDYIKNVASSEIYSTWPRETIKANILAIMSFTLNRVFTEWYRNKGYPFTITSSTAFDHKWIYGRNIFENISEVVDELFAMYLSRPNVRQPILTQYCDGKRVTCPNWLSQWGSKSLGDQGYNAIDIIRYYYGDNMYINTAEAVSGVPVSWPGYSLDIGSYGEDVEKIQSELNAISRNYPLIPRIAEDGIYGERTQEAVRVFQSVFGLPQSGVVDYSTWYKIQEIYVGVTRIAELT